MAVSTRTFNLSILPWVSGHVTLNLCFYGISSGHLAIACLGGSRTCWNVFAVKSR
jgi:hypothetical protein